RRHPGRLRAARRRPARHPPLLHGADRRDGRLRLGREGSEGSRGRAAVEGRRPRPRRPALRRRRRPPLVAPLVHRLAHRRRPRRRRLKAVRPAPGWGTGAGRWPAGWGKTDGPPRADVWRFTRTLRPRGGPRARDQRRGEPRVRARPAPYHAVDGDGAMRVATIPADASFAATTATAAPGHHRRPTPTATTPAAPATTSGPPGPSACRRARRPRRRPGRCSRRPRYPGLAGGRAPGPLPAHRRRVHRGRLRRRPRRLLTGAPHRPGTLAPVPLPDDSQTPWPLPGYRDLWTDMLEASAWYAGDPQRLMEFYGGRLVERPSVAQRRRRAGTLERGWSWFWGRQDESSARQRVHVPAAADIAATSADLPFGDEPILPTPHAHGSNAPTAPHQA